MPALVDYQVHKRTLRIGEYQSLRATTDWNQFDADTVASALKNDLYAVCISAEGRTIAMGRVIGDGALYYYIQDVIVHPEFRGKGLGQLIMHQIDNYLSKHAPANAFIGLMAASGTSEFYMRLGYQVRPEDRPGMYRIIGRPES